MGLIDQSGQSGDHHVGNVAGGNVSTNDPGPWLTFLRGYLHDLDAQRQRRDEELAHELAEARDAIARLGDEVELYQASIAARLSFVLDALRVARLVAAAALLVAALALGLAVLL